MRNIAANIARLRPSEKQGWSAMVEGLQDRLAAGPRADMPVLAGAALFVLLIACANVATILLGRASSRRHEITVRAALGATRWRLVRQLMAESLLLSLLAGTLGTGLAVWILQLIERAVPARILPVSGGLTIDGPVLAFTMLLSVSTAVLFGLVPAWMGSKVDLRSGMNQGTHSTQRPGRARFRSGLAVAEVALSFMLMAGAGIMARSLIHAREADVGFDPSSVLTMRVELPPDRYQSPDEIRAFHREALLRLKALPAVNSAAWSTQLPMRGWAIGTKFAIAEHAPVDESSRLSVHVQIVSPEYYRALGIKIRHGRDFSDADIEGAPRVAVVNESFVRRYLSEDQAMGKHIRLPELRSGVTQTGTWNEWEIIGAVDALGTGDISIRPAEVYLPSAQLPLLDGYFSLRTEVEPEALTAAVENVVASIDNSVWFGETRSMKQIRAEVLSVPNMLVSVVGGFGVLALLLSMMGIYGLMSWQVVERTQEIGIRTALGAGSAELIRMIMGKGAFLVSIGLTIGFAGAFALGRVLRNLLVGVGPHDPASMLTAAGVLIGTAALSTFLPARRASRVDPLAALRKE